MIGFFLTYAFEIEYNAYLTIQNIH